VTIAAVDSQIPDVELVAVRDRLDGGIADVGEFRRAVIPDPRDGHRGQDQAGDRDEQRELVQPAWEELRQARLSSLVVDKIGLHGRSREFKRAP
jgi:hypothetical protein